MITDNYVKMCEQAEEIQADFKFSMGDWYIENYNTEDQHIIVLDQGIVSRLVQNIILKKYGAIWLPTQEQLQEMMKTENTWRLGWLMENLYNFANNKYGYNILSEHYVFKHFDSLNELWLAFVMYKKYHKVWTGEKWIKWYDVSRD